MTGLVAGTLVQTQQGLKPISEIQVGELVLSRTDDPQGELVYKPVTQVIETEK